LGRASGKVSALVGGTPAGDGDRPRQLVEALSGGRLGAAVRALPYATREAVVAATHQGFLTGLNSILDIGAAVAFAGAVLALWLCASARSNASARRRPTRPPTGSSPSRRRPRPDRREAARAARAASPATVGNYRVTAGRPRTSRRPESRGRSSRRGP
jgi:hypothetical protein